MDSSSAVEDSGDKTTSKRWLTGPATGDGEEDCDAEAWEALNKGFIEAQSVLDQNRLLIQKVNENHQSKIPDNLVKNVALIQEINGNISKATHPIHYSIHNLHMVENGTQKTHEQ
ncbi:hypothetical protein R6Q57_028316 [Mikania cordata]